MVIIIKLAISLSVLLLIILLKKKVGPDQFKINLKEVFCPKCGAKAPGVRKPKNVRQALWGGWTCDQCGCEMDKWGKNVNAES